ncbi:hypothetical protein DF3PB_600019 [uncultured Defluviicoccus sp.]|uniref:Uncharacterized protein n=1 Tax=metagenome TaxID=256318 RepID=A0A380TIG9_9ZZZZ|nr:hypothetical protein DF3PB_600019 [uncultured Defluviicoccus sp.]
MQTPKLDTLPEIRKEIEGLYFLVKSQVMIPMRAKELVGILKVLASIMTTEKELDIQAELEVIREQIKQMKGVGE